ncbi:2OG-Fe(II) oxygenase [Streptomyces sp. NPDC018352]|uniref:2OG-Fe(II) oxygenase n=1 Tax=Streptomyces sp. NPDC018352 TaxID=3157194 RepID=UPI0033D38BB2
MNNRTATRKKADRWHRRVESGDWEAITAEVNEYGGALLPQLLTFEETAEIRELYDQDNLFRSTVDMGRHRFGEGQYRYFNAPYPQPIERLKQALYPRLLPIARDWWTKLSRPAPWPDIHARARGRRGRRARRCPAAGIPACSHAWSWPGVDPCEGDSSSCQ